MLPKLSARSSTLYYSLRLCDVVCLDMLDTNIYLPVMVDFFSVQIMHKLNVAYYNAFTFMHHLPIQQCKFDVCCK